MSNDYSAVLNDLLDGTSLSEEQAHGFGRPDEQGQEEKNRRRHRRSAPDIKHIEGF